jgi:hypothetical protein
MVDPGEISNEINQIFGAGFGGAEIEDVHPSITVSVHPDGHGWATDPWITAVNTASQHAKSLGLQIDISLGPSYPASVPTLRPDDDGAAKELVSVGFLWLTVARTVVPFPLHMSPQNQWSTISLCFTSSMANECSE